MLGEELNPYNPVSLYLTVTLNIHQITIYSCIRPATRIIRDALFRIQLRFKSNVRDEIGILRAFNAPGGSKKRVRVFTATFLLDFDSSLRSTF